MRIGIYNRWLSIMGGGEKHSLAIAEYLSLGHSVDFISQVAVPTHTLSERFNLDLSRIRFVIGNKATGLRLQDASAKYDLFISASFNDFFKSMARHSATLIYFPRAISARARILASVDSYSTIWANSEFTKEWIARYWNRKSSVLYPPVDCPAKSGSHLAGKQEKILSVGRFFAGGHNKKHLVMIEAFKQLVDKGLTGWALYLAGGTSAGTDHAEYLGRIFCESSRYPIHILPDISGRVLRRLFRESSIYWHACGYGEVESASPSRLEHFGVATLEAMAWGCVPIVIGMGGQVEIVASGVNGFTWRTVDELTSLTSMLIKDGRLRQSLARAASARARSFTKASFRRRLQLLIDNILTDSSRCFAEGEHQLRP